MKIVFVCTINRILLLSRGGRIRTFSWGRWRCQRALHSWTLPSCPRCSRTSCFSLSEADKLWQSVDSLGRWCNVMGRQLSCFCRTECKWQVRRLFRSWGESDSERFWGWMSSSRKWQCSLYTEKTKFFKILNKIWKNFNKITNYIWKIFEITVFKNVQNI